MNVAMNIRGTGGSGKTYIVQHLRGDNSEAITLGPAKTPGCITKDGIVVVGPYGSGKCGGLDRVRTQALCKEAVRAAMQLGRPVVFEGLLVSGIFGPWHKFSQECRERGEGVIVWAFLQTPVDMCLKRIYQRNGGKPIIEHHIIAKAKQVISTRRKFIAEGEVVLDLPLENPLARVREFFQSWQERYPS